MWSSWYASAALPSRMEPSSCRVHFRNLVQPDWNWRCKRPSRMITVAVQSGLLFSDKCSDDSPIPNPVRTLRRSLSADADVCVGFGCGRNAGNQRFDAGGKQNNAQETRQLIGKAFKPLFPGAQCNHQQDARRGGKEFAQENGARARAAENRFRPGRTNSGSVNP